MCNNNNNNLLAKLIIIISLPSCMLAVTQLK